MTWKFFLSIEVAFPPLLCWSFRSFRRKGREGVVILASYNFHFNSQIIWCNIQVIINPLSYAKLLPMKLILATEKKDAIQVQVPDLQNFMG